MAKAETKRMLEEMHEFIGNAVRKQVAGLYSMVTFTAEGVGQGIKEGYVSLKDRLGDDYIEFEDDQWTEWGQKAVDAIREWAQRERTSPTEIMQGETGGDLIQYAAKKDVAYPYTLAKKTVVDLLQKEREAQGGRRLKGKQKGERALASEVGQVKVKSHKLHKGATTVGGARLAAAMEYLSRQNNFGGFATSKAATDLMELYDQVKLVYKVEGTEKAKITTLGEDIRVQLIMGSMSDNPAGGEPFDYKNISPILRKAMEDYLLESGQVTTRKGSKSIEQNVKDQTLFIVTKELLKSTNTKSKKTIKKSVRKASTTEVTKSQKVVTVAESTKKARSGRSRQSKVNKGIASNPLRIIGLLNKKLPDTVRKNMNAPALENRTGRFVDSVEVTDIVKTPQGYPSIGYKYAKNPYQVFEMGAGSPPWATPERDPRKLIDRSIREIAAQFAIGRFYTRRV